MEHFFIINPAAGDKDNSKTLITEIHRAAQVCGIPQNALTILITEYAGHAKAYAERVASDTKYGRVYAAGGDGTLNEAASALIHVPHVSLGCIPCGSGNDFVKNFPNADSFKGIEKQFTAVAQQIDVISTGNEIALSIASAGLDARIAHQIPKYKRLPFCGGKNAYIISMLKELSGTRSQKMRVHFDGETYEDDCLMVAVCNGRAYGGGFYAAPMADLQDGILEIMVVRNVPLLKLPGAVGKYQKGQHWTGTEIAADLSEWILHLRGREVRVEPAAGNETITVNRDGECVVTQELFCSVLENALSFLIPQDCLCTEM